MPGHLGFAPDVLARSAKQEAANEAGRSFLYFGMLRRVRPYGRGLEPHGGCTIVRDIQISKARATNKTGIPFAMQHVVGPETCIKWSCVRVACACVFSLSCCGKDSAVTISCAWLTLTLDMVAQVELWHWDTLQLP